MVPVHESDVAENRWKESEWRQFELWERIELRLRRKKTWTILAVVVAFIAILSISIFQDRMPKWRALKATRILAVRANQMKVDAASLGVPLRLRVENAVTGPVYVIEKVASCAEGAAGVPQEWGRGTVFRKPEIGEAYTVLAPEIAREMGLERVSQSLCYDPTPAEGVDERTQAVGILSVKDLADRRMDRASFLNFSGLFAEIDFD